MSKTSNSSTSVVAGCETCEHKVVWHNPYSATVCTVGVDLSDGVPVNVTEKVRIDFKAFGILERPDITMNGAFEYENSFTVVDEGVCETAGECQYQDSLAAIGSQLAERSQLLHSQNG